MSGKDLLAVLAMIAPSFLLIALIAVALLPSASKVAGLPGTGFERNTANKDPRPQAGAKKDRSARGDAARARQGVSTQDLIRDFWGRPYCASCVQVTEPARCNSSARDDERSC